MIRKIIKTCECFVDVCLTISVENTDGYIIGQKYVFHSGSNWMSRDNKSASWNDKLHLDV